MKPGQSADERIEAACQLGECGSCSGNIDLQPSRGRRVLLMRCAHPCHRGQIRVVKLA